MSTKEPPPCRRPSLGLPSHEELSGLHLATLEILERVGVKIHSKPARSLLEGAGAKIKGDVAKLPPWLVKECLGAAPPMVYLPGRTAHRDRILAPGKIGFTCAAEAEEVLDLDAVKVKRANAKWLAQATTVIDDLPVVSLAQRPLVTEGDGVRSVSDYNTMVNLTAKHVLITPESGRSLGIIMDMAKAAAGARRTEGLGHPVSFIARTGSPLRLPEDACDIILTGAAREAVICVMSSTVGGGAAPLIPAAAMVIHNAEILTGIVLAQLAKKGAKVIYGSSSLSMRPKFGAPSAGSPETAAMGTIAARLASIYQLPSLVAGARGDSKLPDAQSGHEKTLTALLPAIAGANMIHGLGGLEGGALFSLEQLLMDADFASMILFAMRGLAVNERAISHELVDESVHHAHHASHAAPNRSIQSTSKLIDRRARKAWLDDGGGMDMYLRAKANLKEILESRHGEPLTEAAKEAVSRIAQEA